LIRKKKLFFFKCSKYIYEKDIRTTNRQNTTRRNLKDGTGSIRKIQESNSQKPTTHRISSQLNHRNNCKTKRINRRNISRGCSWIWWSCATKTLPLHQFEL